MNKKQKKVLISLFTRPTPANISWKDVGALLTSLGAEVSEGNGSRVRIALHGVRAVFHKPHPHKEMDKGAVTSMRRFLEHAGVKL